MTDLYGILGYPVAHTRSPAMQNAAFRALNIDATYLPFAVPPEQIPAAIAGLRALGIAGVNVTIPHKEAVLKLLDEVTPGARAIGAVNTIVRAGERLVGHNTDAGGLARSLLERAVPLEGARVVVLGAGGSARAAVVGLAAEGAAHIAVCARRAERAFSLCQDLVPACPAAKLSAASFAHDELEALFRGATLVVQATDAPLGGGSEAEAFAARLPLAALPPSSAIVDLVYKPRETSVLAAARALGHTVVDGLGMLLHQGALAFELWTGKQAPLDVMRATLG